MSNQEGLSGRISIPRLDVRCMGSSTLVGHGLHAEPCSSVVVIENDAPMMLIGCGPGVVRSCIDRIGSLPMNIFLPSTKLIAMSDLQVAIQHEAKHQRKLKIYAPGDVLDKAVTLLDEDIIPEVRDYVEFLQVEPGVATSVTPQYCLVCQQVNPFTEAAAEGNSSCTAFNFVLMDISQRPLLSYLEGPLVMNNDIESFRAAPCCVLHLWRGFRLDAVRTHFQGSSATAPGGHPSGGPRIVAIGYSSEEPPSDIRPPALALRPGDTFSLPLVRAASHDGDNLGWLSGAGENPPSIRRTVDSQAQQQLYPPHTQQQQQQYPQSNPQQQLRPQSRTENSAAPTGRNHQDGTFRELESGVPRTSTGVRARTPPATSRQYPSQPSARDTYRGNEMVGGHAGYQASGSTFGAGGYTAAAPTTAMGSSSGAAAASSSSAVAALGRSNSGRSITPKGSRSFRSVRLSGAQKYEPRSALFSQAAPPRKLYVFSNEILDAEPVIVMIQPHMNFASLKAKISQLLNLKPMGHLHTIDDGLVRTVDQLEHCQEVVATKHAGAPFDPERSRFPLYMKATRRAVPIEDVLPMVDLY